MAADKHFDEHGVVPESLDDHKPDDQFAAKWLVAVVIVLVLMGAVGALLISRQIVDHPVIVPDVERTR